MFELYKFGDGEMIVFCEYPCEYPYVYGCSCNAFKLERNCQHGRIIKKIERYYDTSFEKIITFNFEIRLNSISFPSSVSVSSRRPLSNVIDELRNISLLIKSKSSKLKKFDLYLAFIRSVRELNA